MFFLSFLCFVFYPYFISEKQILISVQNKTGQDRLGHIRIGQDRLGQVRTGQDRSGQVRMGHTTLGQYVPGMSPGFFAWDGSQTS